MVHVDDVLHGLVIEAYIRSALEAGSSIFCWACCWGNSCHQGLPDPTPVWRSGVPAGPIPSMPIQEVINAGSVMFPWEMG